MAALAAAPTTAKLSNGKSSLVAFPSYSSVTILRDTRYSLAGGPVELVTD